MWEEFNRQNPHITEEVKPLEEKQQTTSSFFEPYGFTVKVPFSAQRKTEFGYAKCTRQTFIMWWRVPCRVHAGLL